MVVFIIRNLLASMALSKYDMDILHHRENTLPVSEYRLSMSFWFPFEMFSFSSQGVVEGKESTMTLVHDLLTIF